MRRLALAVFLCAATLACVSPFAVPPEEPRPSWPVRHARQGDSWQSDLWGFQGGVTVGPNDVVERPEVRTNDVHPIYTEGARRKKISGVVVVELRIDAEGHITDIVVTRSLDPELDQAAFDAVRQWTFQPEKLNEAPLPTVMAITVNFQIQ